MTRPPSPGEILVGFSVSRCWRVITHGLTKQSADHVWLTYRDQNFHLDMVLDARAWGYRLTSLETFAQSQKVLAVARPGHSLLPGLRKHMTLCSSETLGARCARWVHCKWKHPLLPALGTFGARVLVKVLRDSHYPGVDLPDSATPQDLLTFFVREGSICALI